MTEDDLLVTLAAHGTGAPHAKIFFFPGRWRRRNC